MEDAVERMKLVEKWPMGDDARLRELAERLRHADSGKPALTLEELERRDNRLAAEIWGLAKDKLADIKQSLEELR